MVIISIKEENASLGKKVFGDLVCYFSLMYLCASCELCGEIRRVHKVSPLNFRVNTGKYRASGRRSSLEPWIYGWILLSTAKVVGYYLLPRGEGVLHQNSWQIAISEHS